MSASPHAGTETRNGCWSLRRHCRSRATQHERRRGHCCCRWDEVFLYPRPPRPSAEARRGAAGSLVSHARRLVKGSIRRETLRLGSAFMQWFVLIIEVNVYMYELCRGGGGWSRGADVGALAKETPVIHWTVRRRKKSRTTSTTSTTKQQDAISKMVASQDGYGGHNQIIKSVD